MADIAAVVDNSAVCNVPQLVHTEDCAVVPPRDWATFLVSHFRKITNIKQYHHFRFSSSCPGKFFVRLHADTTEVELSLLRDDWHPVPDHLPPQIQPKGLSDERQWYLYERIRPFCSVEHRDTVAPQPSLPNPKRRRTPVPED